MIVATCLNPALDVTYDVPGVRLGEAHRVARVLVRAGGKGINVARVLGRLGATTLLVAPVGGVTGDALAADLDGVPHRLVPVAGETRRSVAVVDGSTATVFNEAGPVLDTREWIALRTACLEALAGATVGVLSGSRPPGTPVDAYAQFVDGARGVPTVLDADGESLLAALPAGPAVVKVNVAEALAAVGGADARDAAHRLVGRGAGAAVVTLGADGLLALVDGTVITVRLPTAVAGNPTGAGDALAAAVAHGLAQGHDWPRVLADAAAVSASAVAVAHAGDIDPDLAARLRPDVEVTVS